MLPNQPHPTWDGEDWQLALEAITYYRRTIGLDETTEQHASALIETIASSGALRRRETRRVDPNQSYRL